MKSTLSLLLLVAVARAQTIDECLNKDSISCIQKTLFRKAKDFFGKDSVEIVNGVSLVKGQNGRESRSGKALIYEQQIEKTDNVVERQSALEKFLGEEVSDFVKGRSLKINFKPVVDKIGATARAANELIPAEIRLIADQFIEGRGKKKYFKHMMPLIWAAKAKFGLLAAMSYFAIAMLAKKAIIAAAISIAISVFLALKHHHHHKTHHEKHEHHEHHDHHEHHEHDHHHKKHGDHHHHGSSLSSSWSAPNGWTATTGWDDGANSAQTQAYSAYNR